jgi:adenylate cyclase
MKPDHECFGQFWDDETIDEIGAILRVTAHRMAIPLFALFWVADLLYVPQLKWQFLLIRLLIIPVCLSVSHAAKGLTSARSAQVVALLYAVSLASGLNLMVFLIPDPGTGYYAGLNLVAIGCLSFIPFTRLFYLLTASGIYLPYYLIVAAKASSGADWRALAVNSFFIFSSICICFLIRFFHENTRIKEVMARLSLRDELQNRDEIIRNKTDEAVRLSSLYSQFSPQIVDSIRSGKLKLDAGGRRVEICAIFIDIVNSTEQVNRIEQDPLEKVLSRFLDDTIKILLKYDITIDKFLGDGILAFCNAPLPRVDYISRVLKAALEIREKIERDQEFFERHWQAPLQIRIGIAKGFVNVGFYGSQKYFRSYTAIGPVVNLASRLCSGADAGQIVIDRDIHELIKDDFETRSLGERCLKGFDATPIHAYEVRAVAQRNGPLVAGVNDCPGCDSIMSLETNAKGQFVFMCKTCSYVVELNAIALGRAALRPDKTR